MEKKVERVLRAVMQRGAGRCRGIEEDRMLDPASCMQECFHRGRSAVKDHVLKLRRDSVRVWLSSPS